MSHSALLKSSFVQSSAQRAFFSRGSSPRVRVQVARMTTQALSQDELKKQVGVMRADAAEEGHCGRFANHSIHDPLLILLPSTCRPPGRQWSTLRAAWWSAWAQVRRLLLR
jgi:hypothetical protein